MSAVINIVGQKFGRLLVTGRAENKSSDRQALWLCSCDCGCTHIAKSRDLRAGKVKSCGCLPNRGNLKHGMRKSEEYGIWCKIKSRCCNEADAAYASYGGRGIRVCDDWLNSFDSFYKCMGARPSPEHSIDRIDNNQGYSPENCRWSTAVEQGRNKRNTLRVGGVKLKDISDTSVATYAVMHRRLKTGKDISPGVRNLCVKHVFSVDDQHLTLSEIAARIGKSYNYVYHQLITKGRDTKGLLA